MKTLTNYIDVLEGTCLVLKHSATCPVSAAAHREVEAYESEGTIPVWKVTVQENRELSNEIAQKTGIRHESPQLFLYKEGNVEAHASHWNVTKDWIDKVVTK